MSNDTSTRKAAPSWGIWAVLAVLFIPALVILGFEAATQATGLREEKKVEETVHSETDEAEHSDDDASHSEDESKTED